MIYFRFSDFGNTEIENGNSNLNIQPILFHHLYNCYHPYTNQPKTVSLNNKVV